MNKRSLSLSMLFIAFPLSLRAQTAIPPDTTFPLGGLTQGAIGSAANSIIENGLPLFGLNMEYNGPLPLGPEQGAVVGVVSGTPLMTYLFPAGSGQLGYNPLFAEWDFDLVSNELSEDQAAWDLQYQWVNPVGQQVPPPPAKIFEWDIPIVASGTLLDASGSNVLIPTFNSSILMDFLGGANILYLDFIYRLDPANTTDPSYAITTSANVVEQQSTDNGTTWQPTGNSTTLSPFDNAQDESSETTCNSCVIHLSDFNDYRTSDYAGSHFGNDYTKELSNILSFPNTKMTGMQSNLYSVFRLKFDISRAGFNTTPQGNTIFRIIVPSVSFTLSGSGKGIFVRGVRIRNDYADDLFRDKFLTSSTASDGNKLLQFATTFNTSTFTGGLEGPNGIFPYIENLLVTSQYGNEWPQARLINVGNESNWPMFRSYAYINEKFRAWSKAHGGTQKDFCTFLANTSGDYGYYRSIYEDQSNGTPPPPLQAEGQFQPLGHTSIHGQDHDFSLSANSGTGNMIFPGDAIPSAVKNHPNFDEFERTISGWNETSSSYGMTNLSTGTTTTDPLASYLDDYADYTSRFQSLSSGADENIAGGSMSYAAAMSSYPQDKPPSMWTPFYGYPSAIESLAGRSQYAPSNFDGSDLQKGLLSAIRNGVSSINGGTGPIPFKPAPASDYQSLHSALTPSTAPSTPWEIREFTWDAITWGAKGIIFNPIGSDGNNNIGFCGNNFEDKFNSGFSDIPPDVSAPQDVPGRPYPFRSWVTQTVGNQTTYYYCITYPQSTTDPPNPQDWESQGLYPYYGNINIKPTSGYLIPPQTAASQMVDGVSQDCFPDHLLIPMDWDNSGELVTPFPDPNDLSGLSPHLWIPCISDVTITNNGAQDINIGDHITSGNFRDYLQGILGINNFQATAADLTIWNSYTIQADLLSDLKTYYEQNWNVQINDVALTSSTPN